MHEDPDYIAWCVRRALRASASRGAPLPAAVPALSVPQPPPALGFLPLMLLGPMGCGKSTLLVRTFSEACAASTPAVLVRWRLSESAKDAAATDVSDPSDAALVLASEALFQQIDFPPRRAMIFSVLKSGLLLMGQRSQADFMLPETRDRLLYALRVLFKAAEDVQAERIAAGIAAFDAAPVLLFDEAHDLIKDARLARAGGSAIFKHLALLIISYSVDRRAVRTIVAGSSVELDTAFMANAPYGNRWRHYELMDPAPEAVAAALEARGYAPSDARALIAECGTRLRLLQDPLQGGPDVVGAAGFIAASVAASDKAVAALFQRLAPADAAALARTLSAIAAADEEAIARAPQHLRQLPAAVRAAGDAFSSVVYADFRGRVHFQSRPVAHAWARACGPAGEWQGPLK